MKATKRTTRRKYLVRASLLASAGAMSTLTGIAANAGTASASSTVTLQFWNTYNPAGNPSEVTTMQASSSSSKRRTPGSRSTDVKSRTATSLAKFIAAAAAGRPARRAALRHRLGAHLAADGVLLNMSRQKWAQPILKGALARPAVDQLLRR